MKAKKVNEDFMDDLIGGDQAVKAINKWDKMYREIPDKKYTINMDPCSIVIQDDVDYRKLVSLLEKYDFPFEVDEKSL